MENKMSPFSTSHEYEFEWERIPSSERPTSAGLAFGSDKEDEMLEAVGNVGIIGSKQLKRIYLNNNKNKLKKLVRTKKLKKHTMKKGNNPIPVYTLGTTGFYITNRPEHDKNIWTTYKKHQVLQSLVLFQLFARFKEWDEDAQILESERDPYNVAVLFNGKLFNIIALRGNENSVESAFKWEAPLKRTIIVVENLNHLQPISEHLIPHADKIRVTTDHDLNNQDKESMFYKYMNGEWVRESNAKKQGV